MNADERPLWLRIVMDGAGWLLALLYALLAALGWDLDATDYPGGQP